VLNNFGGTDWTGKKDLSKNPNGARALVAGVVSFIEGQVPLASQAVNVAGIRTPNMADSTKIDPSMGTRARAQFDPFRYTPSKRTFSRGRVRTKSGFDFNSGGQGFDFSGSGGSSSGGFNFSG
jgi:uncharacterized membrane protein YgcG